MTLVEAVYAHPWWSCVFLLLLGVAVAQVAGAIVEPLAPCRRGNCPRCRGTGGEPLVRRGGPTP